MKKIWFKLKIEFQVSGVSLSRAHKEVLNQEYSKSSIIILLFMTDEIFSKKAGQRKFSDRILVK